MADRNREIMDEFVDALKYAAESGAFGKVLRDNPTGEVSGIKSVEEAQELIDALKNGDFHIFGIGILEDCGDCSEDCDERCIKEDKERFKKLVDGLCCALLHDNDSALCIFQQWRADKCRLENSYDREHAGKISEDEAKELREGCRGGLVSLERAFKNALFGEFFDLLDPMPLVNADFNEVIRARFLKNWQMIEDES